MKLFLAPMENVQIYLLYWTRSITLSFRWTEAAGVVPMRQYLIPNANSRYLSSQVQRAPGQARGQHGLAHVSPSVLAWWIHSSRRMSIAVQKTNV